MADKKTDQNEEIDQNAITKKTPLLQRPNGPAKATLAVLAVGALISGLGIYAWNRYKPATGGADAAADVAEVADAGFTNGGADAKLNAPAILQDAGAAEKPGAAKPAAPAKHQTATKTKTRVVHPSVTADEADEAEAATDFRLDGGVASSAFARSGDCAGVTLTGVLPHLKIATAGGNCDVIFNRQAGYTNLSVSCSSMSIGGSAAAEAEVDTDTGVITVNGRCVYTPR